MATVSPVPRRDLLRVTRPLGLTNVHIDRCLQTLRRTGLIAVKGRRPAILDLTALRRASPFEPACLPADRVGARLDAADG